MLAFVSLTMLTTVRTRSLREPAGPGSPPERLQALEQSASQRRRLPDDPSRHAEARVISSTTVR